MSPVARAPQASPLVTPEWLAQNLGRRDVRVVDGSWHMPQLKRDARAEFVEAHVPGAVFFAVAVLDGGLPRWRAEGRPVESGSAAPKPRRFTARLRRSLVRDLAGMRRNLTTRKAQVLDARSRGRFAGTEPEPRAGLRAGHIPRSLNLPYDELYQKDGTLLPPDALRQKFEASGLDLDKPVVTSCGSGVTASVLALGLYAIGRPDVAVYDGSWTEWGGDGDTPIET